MNLQVRVQAVGESAYGEWREGFPGPELEALFAARAREGFHRKDETWTVELGDGHKAQWREWDRRGGHDRREGERRT